MGRMNCIAVACVLILSCSFVGGASTRNPTTDSPSSSPTTQSPTTKQTTVKPTTQHSTPTVPVTTLAPAEQCARANGSCEDCVKIGSVQCLWCDSKKTCMLKEHVIPTSECPLADAKWAVCWVNYEALIIACSVIGGLLILGLTICICCCCCCKKDSAAKYAREDAKTERKKAEMKQKHADRRKERKEKTDEIRRKYGLIKEDNPYTRFDDSK